MTIPVQYLGNYDTGTLPVMIPLATGEARTGSPPRPKTTSKLSST